MRSSSALERWPARRRPRQPGAPGSRRPPATARSTGCGVSALAREGRARAARRGVDAVGPRGRAPQRRRTRCSPIPDDRLRLDLHVLPPRARAGGAGRADAAHARRPDDARDRPRVPGPRADDRAAARAGEAQDPRRRASRTRCRPATAGRPAGRGAAGPVPRVQRGLRRDRPATRSSARELCARGDPAGARARELHARRAGGARAARAAAAHRRAARRPASTPTGQLVLLEDQDRSAVGSRRDRRGRRRSSSGRCGWAAPGRTSSRRRSRPSTTRPRRRPRPTGRRSSRLYELLVRVTPSPVVALNRAVAVAEVDGPAAGLAVVDSWPATPRSSSTGSSTRRERTSCAGWAAGARPPTRMGGRSRLGKRPGACVPRTADRGGPLAGVGRLSRASQVTSDSERRSSWVAA